MANPFFYKKQMDTTYIDSATSFDTWVDQSDNSHDLTAGATNEPAFNFGDANSEYNPFLRFDGSDDYLSVANHADFNFGVDTNFSVEAIIRTSTSVAQQNIISKGSSATQGYELQIVATTGVVRIRADDGIDLVQASSIIDITDGEFHHIMGAFDRLGNMQVYVDGVADGSAVSMTAVGDMDDATKPLAIGVSSHDLSTSPFNGDIGLVRIWNRALSAAEVLIQYNGGDFWQQTVPAADQYGSQTELLTDIDLSNWTADDLDSWTEIAADSGTESVSEVAAGEFKADAPTGGGGHANIYSEGVYQGIHQTYSSLLVGKNYRPLIDINGINTGGIRFLEQSGTQFDTIHTTAGIKIDEFTATITSARVEASRVTGGPTDDITINKISLVQIGVVAEWRLAHENAFSPFEFPKGRQLPVNFPIVPRQIVGVAGGGQAVVDDLGDADERWPINVLRVSATVRTNLLGFLQDSTVNYREQSFQFVSDEESAVDTEVRLWEPFPLDFPRVPGSLYNLNMVVRKEIS